MADYKPDEKHSNADWPKRTPDTFEDLGIPPEKERLKQKAGIIDPPNAPPPDKSK